MLRETCAASGSQPTCTAQLSPQQVAAEAMKKLQVRCTGTRAACHEDEAITLALLWVGPCRGAAWARDTCYTKYWLSLGRGPEQ